VSLEQQLLLGVCGIQLQDAKLLDEAAQKAVGIVENSGTAVSTPQLVTLWGLLPFAGRWDDYMAIEEQLSDTLSGRVAGDSTGVSYANITRVLNRIAKQNRPPPSGLSWRAFVVSEVSMRSEDGKKHSTIKGDTWVLLKLGAVAQFLRAQEGTSCLEDATGIWEGPTSAMLGTSQDFRVKSLDVSVRHEETVRFSQAEADGDIWKGEYRVKQYCLAPLAAISQGVDSLEEVNTNSLNYETHFVITCRLREADPSLIRTFAQVH